MAKEKKQYDILIIEDDLSTIRLLTAYFESKSFKSKGVINGTRGLEELERNLPKVILLDLTLPDLNWYDVTKQIRVRDIPIFLFGDIAKTDVKVKVLGVVGIISKPFSFEEFEELLKLASKPVIDNIKLWEFDDYDIRD